jgi:hypothetical protein
VSERVLMIGLLGICLGLPLGTVSEAHYQGYIAGVHVSSVSCILGLKAVPNPATHPAAVQCVVATALVELLCKNPAGHEVRPGQAATQVILVAQDQIDQGNITDKKKGKAEVEVRVPDDPLLNPAFCVNPNWIPIEVLIRELTAQINVYECIGPAEDACSVLGTLASTVEADCTLSAEFDFDNLPPPGTPYECAVGAFVHVD